MSVRSGVHPRLDRTVTVVILEELDHELAAGQSQDRSRSENRIGRTLSLNQ